MTATRLAPGALLLLLACTHKPAVEVDPENAQLRTLWNASLATPADLAGAIQMKGHATMGPASSSQRTKISIDLANATPGGTRPWEVHQGQCGGQDGGIVGASADYEPLDIDGDGTAHRTAELEAPVPAHGNYYVAVHAAARNRETLVACGNFAPPVE